MKLLIFDYQGVLSSFNPCRQPDQQFERSFASSCLKERRKRREWSTFRQLGRFLLRRKSATTFAERVDAANTRSESVKNAAEILRADLSVCFANRRSTFCMFEIRWIKAFKSI